MSPRYVGQQIKRNDTLRRLTEQALLGDDVDLTDPLQAICQRYHVEQLALFGSILRADFNAASDVDILVQFEVNLIDDYFTHYFAFKEALEALLGRSIDLVIDKPFKNPYFQAVIDQSRTVIYESRN